MDIFKKVLCRIQSIYEKSQVSARRYLDCERDPHIVSSVIYQKLISPEPCMIARYGATELWCLTNYLSIKEGYRTSKLIDFIKGDVEPWWWMPQRLQNMQNNSGFFPIDEDLIERYCELLLEDTKELDILASWLHKEHFLEDNLKNVTKIFLPYLEPYYSNNPWSYALAGKKVLVIHPFNTQIEHQYYSSHRNLFQDIRVLPDFELFTIKAVQSLGGEENGFANWFDALEYMKTEMDKVAFDICIIGCGAYGFHLAAHAKRRGKKAIHMGGATQLLFGIKGNRWEDPMYGVREWGLPYGFYTGLFNEYWIKPGEEGRPKNADQVEGACYW